MKVPVHIRVYLYALAVSVLVGVLLFFAARTIASRMEARTIGRLITREAAEIAHDIEVNAGEVSLQVIRFSEVLSRELEKGLKEDGFSRVEELSGRPAELEKLISSQYSYVSGSLEWLDSSGVFFILDATVNPGLSYAKESRAGIYLERVEPHVEVLESPLLYLRGFPQIAFDNRLNLRLDWQLEFSIKNRDFWEKPLFAGRVYRSLSPSSWYYWSVEDSPALKEPVAFCTMPLVDSEKNLMGVGGFTMSMRLFRSRHPFTGREYPSIFATISTVGDTPANPRQMLSAGSTTAYREFMEQGSGLVDTGRQTEGGTPLSVFRTDSGLEYVGARVPVRIYRRDSPFITENIEVTVLMPRADYNRSRYMWNRLVSFLFALIAASVVFAAMCWLHSYIKRKTETVKPEPPSLDNFGLSPREKEICILLLQGLSIRQVSEKLGISFSTANSHYHTLYKKLGISTKAELFMKFT